MQWLILPDSLSEESRCRGICEYAHKPGPNDSLAVGVCSPQYDDCVHLVGDAIADFGVIAGDTEARRCGSTTLALAERLRNCGAGDSRPDPGGVPARRR